MENKFPGCSQHIVGRSANPPTLIPNPSCPDRCIKDFREGHKGNQTTTPFPPLLPHSHTPETQMCLIECAQPAHTAHGTLCMHTASTHHTTPLCSFDVDSAPLRCRCPRVPDCSPSTSAQELNLGTVRQVRSTLLMTQIEVSTRGTLRTASGSLKSFRFEGTICWIFFERLQVGIRAGQAMIYTILVATRGWCFLLLVTCELLLAVKKMRGQ